ncbi:hypothetical protein SPONN_2476 [uncultured Candidatus Thioglobus sp.]|nr:hypothetical protein SPONL_796 [uncultured Candidatus Thioglobus sp.]SMN01405.1 hypothetical protein SPONN_2476 [uncultured Candidatus Thioglobus sp.]
MQFTNIENFEEKIRNQNVTVAFFTIQYHNCNIETAYSINQKKFLFAFVDHNIGFTCSLNGINADGYINHKIAVKQLMECRNHDKYDPIHFYNFLNNQLPTITFNQINNQQYIDTVRVSVSEFEDRIYFNHWRDANISERQQNKTIELMGYEVLEFCNDNHLTPVFWSTPTERTLAVFCDFAVDYNDYGMQ